MFKIPLRLRPNPPDPDQADPDQADPDQAEFGQSESGRPEGLEGIPMLGAAAVVFGLLGIFTKGYIFVPLAFICSLVALFLGNVSWAFVGLLLAVAGLLTSPVLLALIGISWLLP